MKICYHQCFVHIRVFIASRNDVITCFAYISRFKGACSLNRCLNIRDVWAKIYESWYFGMKFLSLEIQFKAEKSWCLAVVHREGTKTALSNKTKHFSNVFVVSILCLSISHDGQSLSFQRIWNISQLEPNSRPHCRRFSSYNFNYPEIV